jgi:hypothetical protein
MAKSFYLPLPAYEEFLRYHHDNILLAYVIHTCRGGCLRDLMVSSRCGGQACYGPDS